MLKIEYIWRDLANRIIENQQTEFTITELAKKYQLSTSVVNHALIPLKNLNIVKVTKISSQIIDWERLLLYWATRRNLYKDIVYSTYSNLSSFERESFMPYGVIPTAYTAYRFRFKQVSSDYDHVYFYSNNIEKIRKRYPLKKTSANIFILKPDKYLLKAKKVSLAQLFVDLWNLKEWYAKDFQQALILKIKKKLKQ